MRKIILGLMTLLITVLFSTRAWACGCGKSAGSCGAVEQNHACSCGGSCGQMIVAPEPVEINNTVCPVSGQPIGSMGEGVKYTYEGKTYQLCCAGCIDQFKENPEKYIKFNEEKS